MSNSLRNEKIQKWTLARKGRMSLLASLLEMDKQLLYRMVTDFRLSTHLINEIEKKQKEVEGLEVECIREFDYLKRFAAKGHGRIAKLAQKMGEPTHRMYGLVKATGDSRYLLIQYGTQQVMKAVTEIEREFKGRYNKGQINIKDFLTKEVRGKNYTLKEIECLAGKFKEHADFANHDAAVICQKIGEDKYKVLSMGFDTQLPELCQSHICEKENPHIHALTMAVLNLHREPVKETGELIAFGHSAPCPSCAKRLNKRGIAQVYCYFEPELLDGLVLLAKNRVPVIKINLVNSTFKQINKELLHDAA